MWRSGLALSALLAAGAAFADTPDIARPGASPKPVPPPSVPASVWRPGEGGAAEHLQSGLVCERQVYGFRRVDVHVFDAFGLDVGCGYGDGKTALTLYLTRPTAGFVLAQAYAVAKDALQKRSPQRHPTLISDSQVTAGGLTWAKAVYGEDGGTHSALWMSMLTPRWYIEYRATYPADREGAAEAALARLTQTAQASAGRRLKLCGVGPAIVRQGSRITDPQVLQKQVSLTEILGGAAAVTAAEGGKSEDPQPIAWCPEAPVPAAGLPLLFWRGVRADGQDAAIDRVTAMTVGPAPELDIASDALANLVDKAAAKAAAAPQFWSAVAHQGAQTWIYGYFDRRPSPETAAAFFADLLRNRSRAIGGYRADGKTITVVAPGGEKP